MTGVQTCALPILWPARSRMTRKTWRSDNSSSMMSMRDIVDFCFFNYAGLGVDSPQATQDLLYNYIRNTKILHRYVYFAQRYLLVGITQLKRTVIRDRGRSRESRRPPHHYRVVELLLRHDSHMAVARSCRNVMRSSLP